MITPEKKSASSSEAGQDSGVFEDWWSLKKLRPSKALQSHLPNVRADRLFVRKGNKNVERGTLRHTRERKINARVRFSSRVYAYIPQQCTSHLLSSHAINCVHLGGGRGQISLP